MLEIDNNLRNIVVIALRYVLEHPSDLKEVIQYITSNQRMFDDDMVRTMYYITRDRLKYKDLSENVYKELENFNIMLKELRND